MLSTGGFLFFAVNAAFGFFQLPFWLLVLFQTSKLAAHLFVLLGVVVQFVQFWFELVQ